jgi:hypothetical protein
MSAEDTNALNRWLRVYVTKFVSLSYFEHNWMYGISEYILSSIKHDINEDV